MTLDTNSLKKFAQAARKQLLEQVAARMEQVLQTDSVEVREKEKAVKELQEQIRESSKEAVIDRVAYTWFNRFCALRFMDVNHYTRIGIVSPVEGFTQPEILQEAKQGVIDDSFKVEKQRVFGLLNGQIPSSNPQQEAYRLLLVGACNAYHKQMPFLFPEIENYTELLMPDDLLSENSMLQEVRVALTPETCQDVEVIGWLYQYYISEKKAKVLEDIQRNKKVPPENLPAATQLFTPHWIVRYLVENTLGRLWMLNYPESKLVEQMEYYVRPEQDEIDYLEISYPEEIKVCDPACGSGHILTYAFDLLYAIYAEQGYDPVKIPSLILRNNLFGIEIDKRAGDLAAFALMMKARQKDRRFFNRGVEPNICVLQNITFAPSELDAYKKVVGLDLFTQELWFLLQQFEQADNIGSLIRPQVNYPLRLKKRLEEIGVFNDLFIHNTNEKVKAILRQADYLSTQFEVVVANPPYLGSKGMNSEIKDYARVHYPDNKSDLFAMFIERSVDFLKYKGHAGLVTPYVWMFLKSYEMLRHHLINSITITNLVQLEYNAFEPAVIPVCAYTISNKLDKGLKGSYIKLSEFKGSENQAPRTIEAINNTDCGWFYRTSSSDFNKIPGTPIAYWLSDRVRDIFIKSDMLSDLGKTRRGLQTGSSEAFIRKWYEVSFSSIGFGYSKEIASNSNLKWFPLNSGGKYRKWYGNIIDVVNWLNDGFEIKKTGKAIIPSENLYFQEGLTWNMVSSGKGCFRFMPKGCIPGNAGPCFFSNHNLDVILGYLNSKVSISFLSFLTPTLNFDVGVIAKLPIQRNVDVGNYSIISTAVSLSKNDWNMLETSWDFSKPSLIVVNNHIKTINEIYSSTKKNWCEKTNLLKRLEEENNRIQIFNYCLQDELTPEVPFEEITITCNPHYRYPDSRRKTYTDSERNDLQLADTIKEFISYSVGCMFGRYSLDRTGLILANVGETVKDYFKQVPQSTFSPDEDNVIPLLEGEWFEDDIAERFKEFLKVTFGDENFVGNLEFLEAAIGREIRSYFVKDFYKEHVKMYKKRPIYWLFSSPNGSFNALIYMHRYRPDTISVILNDYLRQYRDKLSAHKIHQEAIERNPNATQREKTRALKETGRINKVLAELKEYEDEILYPLAARQIEIDLDDGVKINYNKFGKALKRVSGLSQ